MTAVLPRRAGLALALALAALAACGRFGGGPERAACTPPADPALEREIEAGGIDQWRLSEAVRREVNAVRCRRDLPPLAEDQALDRAAAYHSGDMASRGFFGHDSPVGGRATLTDRLDQVGARFSHAAENIARTSLYAFDGREFLLVDPANCVFTFERGGPPVPRRSYAGAAARLVENWMDSPGHRRNILDPAMTRHGAGAALRPDPSVCGELMVTQVFAG